MSNILNGNQLVYSGNASNPINLDNWNGSSNITTIGTLTSGTIPNTLVSGLGALATKNIVDTGDINNYSIISTKISNSAVTINKLDEDVVDLIHMVGYVKSITNTPPSSPNEGDSYIVGTSGVNDFSGHDDEIAYYRHGEWNFITPTLYQKMYVLNDIRWYIWNGSSWDHSAERMNSYLLNGHDSNYYTNASNLNSGTLSVDRIGDGTITGGKIAQNTITPNNLDSGVYGSGYITHGTGTISSGNSSTSIDLGKEFTSVKVILTPTSALSTTRVIIVSSVNHTSGSNTTAIISTMSGTAVGNDLNFNWLAIGS